MARKSTILGLPSSVRRELDRLLLEGKLTLNQLRDFIAGCDSVSEVPSRSALGRYAANFKETASLLQESREMARAIAQELGPESVEGEQGRILIEMLRSFFFRSVREKVNNPDAAFDASEFAKMARSLRDMSQAMSLEQDFARRIREEERKKVEAEVKDRVNQLGSAEELKKLTNEELERKIAELAAGKA